MDLLGKALVPVCIILAIVCASLWFTLHLKNAEIESLNGKLSAANEKIGKLEARNAVLEKTNHDQATEIKNQNGEIQKLANTVKQNEAAYQAAMARAQGRIVSSQNEAARLKSLPAPAAEQQCTVFFGELNRYILRRQKP